MRKLHSNGAFVVFGDFAEDAAIKLLASLGHPSSVTFVPTNVTSYAANVNLFKTAHKKYGRVDHAIACAGMLEQGRWFDEELTIDTVAEEPPTIVLDVNLKAVLFFARIAIVYMNDGKTQDQDKSLTMLSSAAGFRPSPGLPVYQVSIQLIDARAQGPVFCLKDRSADQCPVYQAWGDGHPEIASFGHPATERHSNQQYMPRNRRHCQSVAYSSPRDWCNANGASSDRLDHRHLPRQRLQAIYG